MKRLAGIVLALLISAPVWAAPNNDPFVSSLTLNEQNPVVNGYITFTAVYPSDAAQTPKRTQQHYNPQVQVVCDQNGVTVFNQNTIMETKTRITGGWTSQTYPLQLYSNGGNNLTWNSGAASCSAALYSYQAGVLTVWASTNFEVGA